MRPISVSVGPIVSAGNLINAQAGTINQPIPLNGSAVVNGVGILSPPTYVMIVGEDGPYFVEGTDPTGTPRGETVTVVGGTGFSTGKFATVTMIIPRFQTTGTADISAGGGWAAMPSAPIRLDEWADAPVGVQVSITGTANVTVQHSFDNPNDLINPVPLASMFWDTGLVPAGAIGATAGLTFSMATAPLYLRLLLNSGSGSAKMVVTQYNVVEG